MKIKSIVHQVFFGLFLIFPAFAMETNNNVIDLEAEFKPLDQVEQKNETTTLDPATTTALPTPSEDHVSLTPLIENQMNIVNQDALKTFHQEFNQKMTMIRPLLQKCYNQAMAHNKKAFVQKITALVKIDTHGSVDFVSFPENHSSYLTRCLIPIVNQIHMSTNPYNKVVTIKQDIRFFPAHYTLKRTKT